MSAGRGSGVGVVFSWKLSSHAESPRMFLRIQRDRYVWCQHKLLFIRSLPVRPHVPASTAFYVNELELSPR